MNSRDQYNFNSLKEIIGEMKSTLVIHGQSLMDSDNFKKYLELFKQSSCYFYKIKESNPTINELRKMYEEIKKNEICHIIAIGGGLQIDMAKSCIYCIGINPSSFNFDPKNSKESIERKNKFICIPTTAGTGSECTPFAVIFDGISKYSIESASLLPDHVVYDPLLLTSLPQKIRASSSVDALSQAIESLWSVRSTEESKIYALESIKLLNKNIIPFCQNSQDELVLNSLQNAAALSGKAISISKTTGPHAFSYTITALHKVPHGDAVAASLIDFARFNYFATDTDCLYPEKTSRLKNVFKLLFEAMEVNSIESLCLRLKFIFKEINIHSSYKDFLFLTDEDKELILSNINLERLENNPRKVTLDFLKTIL